jgi:hypothetical protein
MGHRMTKSAGLLHRILEVCLYGWGCVTFDSSRSSSAWLWKHGSTYDYFVDRYSHLLQYRSKQGDFVECRKAFSLCGHRNSVTGMITSQHMHLHVYIRTAVFRGAMHSSFRCVLQHPDDQSTHLQQRSYMVFYPSLTYAHPLTSSAGVCGI